ncbi:hypothetical protein [Simiduia agarivorans]|uniref:Uncharacterized protein n=1 Tax=Simiduia agarivorans (strain DSM 21679 / JCM 13881 / BCRC 17597 / SA1) TaxID=1117647 RepID=K4KNX3_SIMAS|nr:hypothetical protein [Simiduia agarivorans]AFV00880.1 hypothetical protein M5M_18755 [Simiduia agarivorans SA1 = DSM 21679]
MQWIERYLEAARPYLPSDHRDELLSELDANLRDQLDEMDSSDPDAEKRLVTALGHPAIWAQKFNPQPALIGAELMPVYRLAIQWMMAILLVWFASMEVLNTLASTSLQPIASLFRVAANSLEAFVWWFTGITLGFYLMEKPIRQLNLLENWQADALPPIAPHWATVSRSEAAFGMVANLIFAGLVLGLVPFESAISAQWAPGTETLAEGLCLVIGGLALIWSGLHFWHCIRPQWSRYTLTTNMALNTACVLLVAILLWVPETFLPLFSAQRIALEPLVQHIQQALMSVVLIVGAVSVYELVRDWRRNQQLNSPR